MSSRFNGDRRRIKLKIKNNPFISKQDIDYQIANAILTKKNPDVIRGFTQKENQTFKELASYRRSEIGLAGNISLQSLKIISFDRSRSSNY